MPTIETCPPASAEVLAQELNEGFESLTPEERIDRAVELFAGRLVVATTCGPTAPVLLEKVRSTAPELQVVNIRTHHETLETAKTVTRYERESEFDFRIFDAEPTPVPLPLRTSSASEPALVEFHRQLKLEAFQEMVDELQPAAYLSGAMRWEPGRQDLPIVAAQGAVIAIRPVVDVNRSETEAIVSETDLPYSKNHFDPAKGSEQKLECGLNTAYYTLADKEEQ